MNNETNTRREVYLKVIEMLCDQWRDSMWGGIKEEDSKWGPELREDFDWFSDGREDWAISWEEGPDEWAYFHNIDPKIREYLHPQGLYIEAVKSWAAAIYKI